MSLRAYSEINLHFTWHVKDNSPVIRDEIANRKVLQWQGGYGVVSFGSKDLQWVLGYVRDQRRHHSTDGTHERLERVEPKEAC